MHRLDPTTHNFFFFLSLSPLGLITTYDEPRCVEFSWHSDGSKKSYSIMMWRVGSLLLITRIDKYIFYIVFFLF